MTRIVKTWHELIRLETFEERYRYLKTHSEIGVATFGHERHLNQRFYTSNEWRRVRHEVIARDLGCDLAMPGHEIYDRIIVHHMNPMSIEEVVEGSDDLINPDYLISVSHHTHNAIHFGDETPINQIIERSPGDTRLW